MRHPGIAAANGHTLSDTADVPASTAKVNNGKAEKTTPPPMDA